MTLSPCFLRIKLDLPALLEPELAATWKTINPLRLTCLAARNHQVSLGADQTTAVPSEPRRAQQWPGQAELVLPQPPAAGVIELRPTPSEMGTNSNNTELGYHRLHSTYWAGSIG